MTQYSNNLTLLDYGLQRVELSYAPYSFSKLDVYSLCPRKFLFKYIRKIKGKQKDMTPLLKGGAVHSILEKHPERSTHKLAPKWQHIADDFIRTHLGLKYLGESSIREFSFGLTADMNPTEYSDKKAIFRGSIDYICIVDGVLHLIDWKTGKIKEQKWQNFDQLMFYAVYFFNRYPDVEEIKISFVYVEHENYENFINLSRDFLGNYTHQLLQQIKDVETDRTMKKKPGPLCPYCDYLELCKPENPDSQESIDTIRRLTSREL